MAKIVQVLNSMISNEEKISNVLKNDNGEYFFLYNGKYIWSISRSQSPQDDDGYYVCFYPQDIYSIEDLACITMWEGISFTIYRNKDIKTQEADETFQELYQIVSEKLYGLDKIFDEIINDD